MDSNGYFFGVDFFVDFRRVVSYGIFTMLTIYNHPGWKFANHHPLVKVLGYLTPS